MDDIYYTNIFNYLKTELLPYTLTTIEKQRIKRQSKNYIIKFDILYKIKTITPERLLRVITVNELDALLYMAHNDPLGGHLSTDSVFDKIRTQYYWPQMYESIREYVQKCDSCQRRGKYKRTEPLHPIDAGNPFYRIGIDIVGPLPVTERKNRYIVTAMDYMTKWPKARALSEATAEQVANFIYEDIICRHGCPQKILSDRGTHFNNQLITRLMEKFQIKHNLSIPYHSQTNGLVERFNRTLSESLAKLVTHDKEWDLYIAPVLFAYRTNRHSTTKIAPFYLLYGRSARLPTDDPLNEQPHGNVNTRIKELINDLPVIRSKAKLQITNSQQKQKNQHDKKIKTRSQFEIGDKVLYYNAANETRRSGKLDPKWKGPYYIHEILINGSYKLREMEGRVLRAPVNTQLLKAYHED